VNVETYNELVALFNAFLEPCNGRFVATARGARVLEEWLQGRTKEPVKIIVEDGRYRALIDLGKVKSRRVKK
jgi:hypothetical protein